MDDAAFCKLVDDYGGALYQFCRRLSPNDADDLYQETFLRAFERRRSLDPGRDVRSYLFKVCVNLWRSNRRKYALRQTEPMDDAVDVPSPEPAPADAVVQKEQSRQIVAAVAALEEKFRIPLALYYTAELRVEEIARILCIPPGTVKSRLHTARKRLKTRLEDPNDA
ncbi:MAG: sigma-70 family RNA polymerase sigma factor [Oscillospiraceae bacterium]|jgi:RNA polymerase sigma-70 factor (ECF subfamily)|nr:sigma-70 family RNA polymerase sigma factor [Oscillospiraceae bacterium]